MPRTGSQYVVRWGPSPSHVVAQQSSLLTQEWSGAGGAGAWIPSSSLSLSGVTAGNLLTSFGGWWNGTPGTGNPTPLPTDSNGTLQAGSNPGMPASLPVHGQIGYIGSAAAGSHTISPNTIDDQGDGYFRVYEWSGTYTLVTAGNNSAQGSAGSVNGITVTSAGSAQVGDLVVAACVTDGDPVSDPPGAASGYATLFQTSQSDRNIAIWAGFKAATSAGTQSAVFAWSDNTCLIGSAVIAVFRRG